MSDRRTISAVLDFFLKYWPIIVFVVGSAIADRAYINHRFNRLESLTTYCWTIWDMQDWAAEGHRNNPTLTIPDPNLIFRENRLPTRMLEPQAMDHHIPALTRNNK